MRNLFDVIPRLKNGWKESTYKERILFILRWILLVLSGGILGSLIVLITVCPYILKDEKTIASADSSNPEYYQIFQFDYCQSLDLTVSEIYHQYILGQTPTQFCVPYNQTGHFNYISKSGFETSGYFSFTYIAICTYRGLNDLFFIFCNEYFTSSAPINISRYSGREYLVLGSDSYDIFRNQDGHYEAMFLTTDPFFSINPNTYSFHDVPQGNNFAFYNFLGGIYDYCLTNVDFFNYYQDKGFQNGHEAGKTEGYEEGFEKGYNAGSGGQFNPVTFVLEPIHQFLEMKIAGNFSIGSFLAIGLFVALALIFLKMFAGG